LDGLGVLTGLDGLNGLDGLGSINDWSVGVVGDASTVLVLEPV
jgi:hypothetical protein